MKKLRFTQQGSSRDLNARSTSYSLVPSFTYSFKGYLTNAHNTLGTVPSTEDIERDDQSLTSKMS